MKLQELTLLKMTAKGNDAGEMVISAITPVSSVELTSSNDEVSLQAYQQLSQRLLETIESELEELKSDLEADT